MLARIACSSYGSAWSVTKVTPGSIVCSIKPWAANCHNCDLWRLLVWADGNDEHPDRDTDPTTKAGHYYCGYYPACEPDYHPYGGKWIGT